MARCSRARHGIGDACIFIFRLLCRRLKFMPVGHIIRFWLIGIGMCDQDIFDGLQLIFHPQTHFSTVALDV